VAGGISQLSSHFQVNESFLDLMGTLLAGVKGSPEASSKGTPATFGEIQTNGSKNAPQNGSNVEHAIDGSSKELEEQGTTRGPTPFALHSLLCFWV